MPVLIEAISVVMRLEAIERSYPGGLARCRADCPNQTFCADGHLARVGFTAPSDAGHWVDHLTQYGLIFVQDERAVDLVVVDQVTGPTTICDWLEFGKHDDGYVVAWLAGTEPTEIYVPEGWDFETSLSNQFKLIPISEIGHSVERIDRTGNVETLIERETGQRFYMGRTIPKE